MVNALQTVDTNHASHQQIIQAQAQYLQRLTAEQEAFKIAMQALSEANVRLNESMLAQERESETRKARLEVLERVIGEKLNDALLRVPAETQNLNERLTRIEEWGSQTQMDGRTVASMVDNHQEWQSQVEEKVTDLMTNQQLKEIKFNELLEANSRDSHSRNERLEDKLRKLEHQIETQRRQIVQLEAIPRMTKAELNTPEKEIDQDCSMIRGSLPNKDNHLNGGSPPSPIPKMTRREEYSLLPTPIPTMTKGKLTVRH